ncbi:hypothetical protein BDZ89DRAFT_1092331 [Hymenopellis radicata]|nr:hypothetical protein BDZ89DRAFT_1092331 [Hymenopellis radicata]
MLSVGTLIFVSLRPLIKLLLCVGSGFIVTKADLFPMVAARGAGQIALNITTPCLMFSKIVPAFDSSNIGVLGPLVVIGAIYQALGIVISWGVKQLFWVPHRFRYGILVAGGWGNFGDLPTAVIMSITGPSPFRGKSDQDLAVAYISALVLYYMLTFFPLGGNRLIALDFKGADVEPEEIRAAMKRRHQHIIRGISRLIRRNTHRKSDGVELSDLEDRTNEKASTLQASRVIEQELKIEPETTSARPTMPLRRHVSLYDEVTVVESAYVLTRPPSSTGFIAEEKIESPPPPALAVPELGRDSSQPPTSIHGIEHDRVEESPPDVTRARRTLLILKGILQSLCMSASLSILISFLIALIEPLKALFVAVDGYSMPSAPDGEPPLAVLYDFADFMGAASVPLNLVCLGSALARLNVPRSQWPSLPLGAIFSLAVGRMILMPVLGVLICVGLIHVNFISQDDKVLQFICIFFSCLPTGTTQVFVTQVYSGTGDAEHLSAFLIPQYILMFLSMTVLSAYTLQLIF